VNVYLNEVVSDEEDGMVVVGLAVIELPTGAPVNPE
jgi:hypothetical protein